MTMDFNTQGGGLFDTLGEQVSRLVTSVKDYQTGMSLQGNFEVDPERLPQLKADLESVYQEAEAALKEATKLSALNPPAMDDVSVQSANNIKKVVEDGDGSLIKTCEDIMKWIESFQDQVEKAINDYQRIDDENRMA